MNLEQNLIDNILECEIKLGHEKMPISFYYPLASLLELLSCKEEDLPKAVQGFLKEEEGKLGQVGIKEVASEKGRFGVTVPADGVEWVSSNFTPSEFMKSFAVEIKRPGNDLEKMKAFFEGFSKEVIVEKVEEKEWAFRFADEEIDPYVYYIEENAFGLEYHRFTLQAYHAL